MEKINQWAKRVNTERAKYGLPALTGKEKRYAYACAIQVERLEKLAIAKAKGE